MQLTNIIRDVGDDARRGRIYLPVDELQQFDVKAHEILEPRCYSERFTALMQFQAERAHRTLRRGAARCCPRPTARAQKPGLMMANIYRTPAARDRGRRTSRCCTSASRLTPLRKLWIAMQHQLARPLIERAAARRR